MVENNIIGNTYAKADGKVCVDSILYDFGLRFLRKEKTLENYCSQGPIFCRRFYSYIISLSTFRQS